MAIFRPVQLEVRDVAAEGKQKDGASGGVTARGFVLRTVGVLVRGILSGGGRVGEFPIKRFDELSGGFFREANGLRMGFETVMQGDLVGGRRAGGFLALVGAEERRIRRPGLHVNDEFLNVQRGGGVIDVSAEILVDVVNVTLFD